MYYYYDVAMTYALYTVFTMFENDSSRGFDTASSFSSVNKTPMYTYDSIGEHVGSIVHWMNFLMARNVSVILFLQKSLH